jgi:hypothetical protein
MILSCILILILILTSTLILAVHLNLTALISIIILSRSDHIYLRPLIIVPLYAL